MVTRPPLSSSTLCSGTRITRANFMHLLWSKLLAIPRWWQSRARESHLSTSIPFRLLITTSKRKRFLGCNNIKEKWVVWRICNWFAPLEDHFKVYMKVSIYISWFVCYLRINKLLKIVLLYYLKLILYQRELMNWFINWTKFINQFFYYM